MVHRSKESPSRIPCVPLGKHQPLRRAPSFFSQMHTRESCSIWLNPIGCPLIWDSSISVRGSLSGSQEHHRQYREGACLSVHSVDLPELQVSQDLKVRPSRLAFRCESSERDEGERLKWSPHQTYSGRTGLRKEGDRGDRAEGNQGYSRSLLLWISFIWRNFTPIGLIWRIQIILRQHGSGEWRPVGRDIWESKSSLQPAESQEAPLQCSSGSQSFQDVKGSHNRSGA